MSYVTGFRLSRPFLYVYCINDGLHMYVSVTRDEEWYLPGSPKVTQGPTVRGGVRVEYDTRGLPGVTIQPPTPESGR